MKAYCILQALIVATIIFAVPPATASAQTYFDAGVSVAMPPPDIPYYDQPPVPGPDYIWEPGYWAWGPYGYFWVPGTWVLAPEVGLLWTPGYWGWYSNAYYWNPGYWAPQVGFYGGIDYGAGYYGNGYVGGGWYHDHFRYNRYVTNVSNTTRNVYYNRSVYVNNSRGNRIGYNGGSRGISARPTQAQLAVSHARHFSMTPVQRQHVEAAVQNRDLRASINRGRPSVVTVARPFVSTNRSVRSNTTTRSNTIITRSSLRPAYHSTTVAHPAYHSAVTRPAYHPAAVARPVYHPAAVARPVYHPAVVSHPVSHSATVSHSAPQGRGAQRPQKPQ